MPRQCITDSEPVAERPRAKSRHGRLAYMVDVEASVAAFRRLVVALEHSRFGDAGEAKHELEALGFFGLNWRPGRRLKP